MFTYRRTLFKYCSCKTTTKKANQLQTQDGNNDDNNRKKTYYICVSTCTCTCNKSYRRQHCRAATSLVMGNRIYITVWQLHFVFYHQMQCSIGKTEINVLYEKCSPTQKWNQKYMRVLENAENRK